MNINSNKEYIDNDFNTQNKINNFDYDVDKNSIMNEEINKLKNREKSKQLSTASDLEKFLLLNNEEIISDLGLSNYPVKDDDFNLDVKDDTIIIYAKSSYFASIIGLNGLKEKERCLNEKINRNAYDEFDKKIKNLKGLSNDRKSGLLQFCNTNGIDFYSIITNGGCVVQGSTNYLVGIKDTPIISLLSNNNRVELTILHESQHIKFNKYCEQNNIEINGYLKILNEIIAHCTNTKNDRGDIDFEKIFELMKDNENYINVSGFDKNTYINILNSMLADLQNEIKSHDLNDAMQKLVIKYNEEIISDLGLSNYPVKDDDFNLDVKDDTFIIYAKSSYFASLIGLNGIKEKERCLNGKINRDIYDEFDNKIKNLKAFSEDRKSEILQFCENNGIDFNDVAVNGGCVVQGNSNYLVGIKDTPIISLSKNNRIEPTILHESQHIKFNKHCEQNSIKINGYLKILNEIIAHCTNTKNDKGDIDFEKIFELMKDNENYIKISGFNGNTYTNILKFLLIDVQNELKLHDLSTTMQNLVIKYKDK